MLHPGITFNKKKEMLMKSEGRNLDVLYVFILIIIVIFVNAKAAEVRMLKANNIKCMMKLNSKRIFCVM